MFSFRGGKKNPKSPPKWFMWLLLGFMAYSIISTLLMEDLPVENAPLSPQQEEMSRFRFSFVEEGLISRRLDYFVSEIARGKGEKAQCWGEAVVQYKLYTPSGEVVDDMFTSGEVKRLRIGAGDILPGLERGLVDMAKGAKRAVTIRSELAFAHPSFFKEAYASEPVGAIVEVKDVFPPAEKWHVSERLKIIPSQSGTGRAIECGQTAAVVVEITNAQGDVLFASSLMRPLLVTPGSGDAPFALEKAVLGMRSGETRMVIAPSDYVFTEEMSTDGRIWLEGASLPADEAWIMEISSAEPYFIPVTQ